MMDKNYREINSKSSLMDYAADTTNFLDYVKYNLPVVGNLYRSSDDAKFYSDYEKYHGVKVKYPGRHYASYLKSSANELMSVGGKMSRWL